MKKIYELKLGESVKFKEWEVLRVHNGFIYHRERGNGQSSVFVPYSLQQFININNPDRTEP